MRNTKYIIVHHTVTNQHASKQSALLAINRAHDRLQKLHNALWRGIEYHHVVGATWSENTRSEASVGWHSGRWYYNRHGLGIALVGNFEQNTPTEHQKRDTAQVVHNWMEKYGIPWENVLLHRDVKATKCPGHNIDKEVVKLWIEKYVTMDSMEDYEKQIRELNTEIGRVTQERDSARENLVQERSVHKETARRSAKNYHNWQNEIEARKKVEARLQECEDDFRACKNEQIAEMSLRERILAALGY